MRSQSFLRRARGLFSEFKAANGANVTVTFAVAIVPVMGAVGAAVDYSRGNSVKVAMQAALDSTALMLSKTAPTLDQSQLEKQANDYFNALFKHPDAQGIKVSTNYSTDGASNLVVSATANIPARFVGLLGVPEIQVGSSSLVRWGNARLHVALALDTTGSMNSDGKIEALKTATKDLLDQLKAAASANGDIYVSIIPFSKDVNVGKGNLTASWIDRSEWDNENGKCSDSDYKTKSKCLSKGKVWTPKADSTWNGCVTDRGEVSKPHASNYDTNVTPPTPAITATLFAADQYGSCSPQVMSLNYDWTAMKTAVDGFYPAGMTNQSIGLAHAWMSLVGGGPYPAPPTNDPKRPYTKAIILMSDGLNTDNRWDMSESEINTRQAMACANAKAAGVLIYTVQVNTGGDPQSTVLRNCATSPDKFTEIKKANQLVTTFKLIGTELSKLRLAQ